MDTKLIIITLLSLIALFVGVLTLVLSWISAKRHSYERLLRELQLQKMKLEIERLEHEIEIDANNLNLKKAERIAELLTGTE